MLGVRLAAGQVIQSTFCTREELVGCIHLALIFIKAWIEEERHAIPGGWILSKCLVGGGDVGKGLGVQLDSFPGLANLDAKDQIVIVAGVRGEGRDAACVGDNLGDPGVHRRLLPPARFVQFRHSDLSIMLVEG
ncbi:unnamed protein product [Clonostachys chloroleuca]|uniref:Uncharacterized protein n=1 Tax=Clonostachys chloroleuca TaxID=1926264 RepID=A0AA35M603_9HYPO|nr:unnamed protein product [Clonostachys chloroleuca]